MATLLLSCLLLVIARAQCLQEAIEDPPVIVLHSSSPFLATGSRLFLACAAYGNPIPNITWSSSSQGISDYGQLLLTEESVKVTETIVEGSNGIHYLLSILELCDSQPSHITTYTYSCNASNGVTGIVLGEAGSTFHIEPLALEPAILLLHSNGSFEYGGSRISVTCVAFGSPAPTVTWGSPTLGITNLQQFMGTSAKINIHTEEINNTYGDALVLSTLEICDLNTSNINMELVCTASNGIATNTFGDQNASILLDPYVQISSFSFEQRHTTAQLQISFSQVVDSSIFNCNLTALIFLNTSNALASSTHFSPQHPGRCEPVTNNTVVAHLETQDYINLIASGIFTSKTNSYLSWRESLLGPHLRVIEPEMAYQSQTFLALRDPVTISGFDLDFNVRELRVHFNSIINVDTINIAGFVMSNENGTQTYSLTEGEIHTHSYATTVCIKFSFEDLMNIKEREICTTLDNCFATYSSQFATDALVSVLRQDFIDPDVYLFVTTEYIGCTANTSLVPNEVYILQMQERIIRIDCHTTRPEFNPVLSWRQGGLALNGTAPPFNNDWPYHAYAYFPEGMPAEHFGLFTCTSQRGKSTENYIHDINPFIGTPSHLIFIPLFQPVDISVSFASIPQQGVEDIKVLFEPVDHSPQILPKINITNFGASIFYENSVYSIEGLYNIVLNLTTLHSITSTAITIDVLDPVIAVTIFPPVVVIEQSGQVTITCTPSINEVPVHWLIGDRELQDGSSFSLMPPGLHHTLELLLDTPSLDLSGELISCFVQDPELNITLASDVVPVYTVPDQLTVWKNGIELLEDNTFLPLSVDGGGLLNLQCLGTQGNYDLIWNTVGISSLPQVISSPLPNVNVSYVANEANLTLYDFNRFAGTLRCVSQQSGLAVSIHLTMNEDSLVCGIATDDIWNITWGITFAGSFDNQPCPPRNGFVVTGLAYRYCMEDAHWETSVNISSCRTAAFNRLQAERESCAGRQISAPSVPSCVHANDLSFKVCVFGWSSVHTAVESAVTAPVDTKLVPLDTAKIEVYKNVFKYCDIPITIGAAEMLFGTSSSLEDDVRDQQVSSLEQALANTTAVASLFPQDLATVNDIVEGIVGLLRQNIATNRSASLHIKIFDTFDNLLSDGNEEGWKQLQKMKAGSQLLLYNAEQYGNYLAAALDTTTINTSDYGDKIALSRSNIMVEVQKVTQDQLQVMDVVYPASDHPLSDKVQIVLPASLLIARKARATINYLFVNLENFLPTLGVGIETMTATMVISSQIVTEWIGNTQDSEQAELHFSTHTVENSLNPTCVFWNFSYPIGEGMWSVGGVQTNNVKQQGENFILDCTSNHLTAFAAVVDISAGFIPTIAVYVGSSVLLFCSLTAAIALLIRFIFCVNKKNVNIHYFVHLNFALAIISTYTLFLGGLTTAVATQDVCTAVAVLLQYFFTAAFSWLFCEAVVLCIMLKVVNSTALSKCWWLAVFVLGWCLPAIPTGISTGILHQQYGTNKHCWIEVMEKETSGLLWAFIGQILAPILLTGILLAIAVVYCQYIRFSSIDGFKKHNTVQIWILFFGTILLVILLGGAYSFGLVMVNELWDPSGWFFMACSIAVGLLFLTFTLLMITTDQLPYDSRYSSDTKDLLSEAVLNSYELKDKNPEEFTSGEEQH